MPFYNCVVPQNILGISYKSEETNNGTKVVFSHSNDSSRDLYLVPVEVGHKYTVGMDSSVGFEVTFAFASRGVINVEATTRYHNLYTTTGVQRFGETSLSHPHVISTISAEAVAAKEKDKSTSLHPWWYNLHMVIAVPRGHYTSMVAVDGDVALANQKKVDGQVLEKTTYYYGKETGQDSSDNPLLTRRCLLSPLFLFELSQQSSWCFSPRLFEYLTQNVVWAGDEYPQNIERVQQHLKKQNTDFTYTQG